MRFVSGVCAAVAAAVSMAVVLGFCWHGLSAQAALVSLLSGLLVGTAAYASTSGDHRKLDGWDFLMLAVFAMASLRAFLWLIYPVGDEWRVLSPNNLGDLSMHIQFIRYLAAGPAFWPASPILAGVPMIYPPGSDLFNSLLTLMGMPVERGLIWAGLGGSLLTAIALLRWGRAFALAAFLFNGGLAGFAVFATHQFSDFQAELAWKNLFLSMFVTQRALLFALPAGLLLLWSWNEQIQGHPRPVPRWVQWLIYASMPLFSVHTFLFLSLAAAIAWLFNPAARTALATVVAWSVVPATAAIYAVTGGLTAASGLRFQIGWMQDATGPWFWVLNFGITLPLLAVLAWRVRRDPLDGTFVAASLLTFAAGLWISFAPWEWDNMKLFVWAWLACVPALWKRVIAPTPVAARVLLCVALFFSGAVCLVGGLDGRHGYFLANRSEIAQVANTLSGVPKLARIATEPDYNNPVILLGRPVYCGYEGHLWSHGLNYRGKYQTLQSILALQPGWVDVARQIDADWLYMKSPQLTLMKLRGPSVDRSAPPAAANR